MKSQTSNEVSFTFKLNYHPTTEHVQPLIVGQDARNVVLGVSVSNGNGVGYYASEGS
ncbi:MAG: hypothetical protein BAJALOKI1v1_80040 [Promethearchaeota archaeon]|nr:MAG: hypothetical protein BAJALOKI1v1_80040 [Candidatus Lokiarchaeota archaeon]